MKMKMGIAEEVVPLLMLAEAEEGGKREFFDLSKGVTFSESFPELCGKRCLGVGFPGWIFTADEQGNFNLFHLWSRAQIELPRLKDVDNYDIYYVEKAVVSSNPSTSSDYVLMILQGSPASLAFWKPGMKDFSPVKAPRVAYSDITCHDGHFYAPDFQGNVIIVDLSRDEEARVVRVLPCELVDGFHLYILHSLGELLVIARDGVILDDDECSYGVKHFYVYKIDLDRESYEVVNDLGNRSIFLGYSATLAVPVPECKPNRICFTDDCFECYFFIERGAGKDMGIYNMLDGSIEPHYPGESYHKFSPPLWV